MKKSMEMKQKLETLKNEVKQFLVVNKADDAEEKMKELRMYNINRIHTISERKEMDVLTHMQILANDTYI